VHTLRHSVAVGWLESAKHMFGGRDPGLGSAKDEMIAVIAS
jgi:hypothetical protein